MAQQQQDSLFKTVLGIILRLVVVMPLVWLDLLFPSPSPELVETLPEVAPATQLGPVPAVKPTPSPQPQQSPTPTKGRATISNVPSSPQGGEEVVVAYGSATVVDPQDQRSESTVSDQYLELMTQKVDRLREKVNKLRQERYRSTGSGYQAAVSWIDSQLQQLAAADRAYYDAKLELLDARRTALGLDTETALKERVDYWSQRLGHQESEERSAKHLEETVQNAVDRLKSFDPSQSLKVPVPDLQYRGWTVGLSGSDGANDEAARRRAAERVLAIAKRYHNQMQQETRYVRNMARREGFRTR